MQMWVVIRFAIERKPLWGMQMWLVKCPRDGLKGQKQIAYGNAVGHGDIRSRPERAKAMTDATLLPFQGGGGTCSLSPGCCPGLCALRPFRPYVGLLWIITKGDF